MPAEDLHQDRARETQGHDNVGRPGMCYVANQVAILRVALDLLVRWKLKMYLRPLNDLAAAEGGWLEVEVYPVESGAGDVWCGGYAVEQSAMSPGFYLPSRPDEKKLLVSNFVETWHEVQSMVSHQFN
jgi:hypothetical protein